MSKGTEDRNRGTRIYACDQQTVGHLKAALGATGKGVSQTAQKQMTTSHLAKPLGAAPSAQAPQAPQAPQGGGAKK